MLFLVLSALLACGSAVDEAVLKYDTVTFNKQIPQRNHYMLFYAPWASELKTLSPIWEELAQKHNRKKNSDVLLAKIDCSKETKLCSYQDVSEYPTIKFYKTGGPELGIRYRGPLDMLSLEQFMNGLVNRQAEFLHGARVPQMPERHRGLFPLQDENFYDVVSNGPYAVINFCTPWSSRCMDLEPIWKKIAEEFQYTDELLVGQVDCTMSKTTCNENEVRGYPSILMLNEGVIVEKYPSKERDFESLKKYILKKIGLREPSKPAPVKYEEDPDEGSSVLKIDQDNFKEYFNPGNKQYTFIHFWTAWCSECMGLEVIWEALAEYFMDSNLPVVIAKMDCVLQKSLCEELQVDDFPTVNVYREGKLFHTYTGVKKLDELIDFVTMTGKGKKTVEEL